MLEKSFFHYIVSLPSRPTQDANHEPSHTHHPIFHHSRRDYDSSSLGLISSGISISSTMASLKWIDLMPRSYSLLRSLI